MGPRWRWLAAWPFATAGVGVAVCGVGLIAVLKVPPGTPVLGPVLVICDPFLRFPVGNNSVFLMSILFNAVYYFGIGSTFRLIVKKRWAMFGKLLILAAVAAVLNISLVAIFVACEFLLTGQLVAT